jgi:hypothetical protein
MPHFYIDLRDDAGTIRDEEGASFTDIEEALDEAKATARDLAKQLISNRKPLSQSCVEIRDTQGRTVAVLTVAEVLDHPVHPAFKNKCNDKPAPGHR